MSHLSNYPPGSNTPDAPWNQPEADPNDCEVCGRREGEMNHPELGLICYKCWPKCWICGDLAVWDSDGPCCEKHEREAMEDESDDCLDITDDGKVIIAVPLPIPQFSQEGSDADSRKNMGAICEQVFWVADERFTCEQLKGHKGRHKSLSGTSSIEETAPQTFEEWRDTLGFTKAAEVLYVAGLDLGNVSDFALVVWNAAKASSPAVAEGESEMVEENLMLKKFINDIYGGAAQGLLAYSRFRCKQQPLIKDVRGKE